ncbi:SMI1/KNR4 family protein [Streptomyces sp. NPDC004609]|uniref:SMI1/KNR4 family protein n=1 Tax=Streptomyces sp. NPDC004609 TaxID=3364704 RepID=UPI003676B69A
MEIFQFRDFLGVPQVNSDVSSDWDALESIYGDHLPDDYKKFVSAYGPGCVNDQLYIFHPRASGSEGLRLGLLWEQASQTYEQLSRDDPEAYPYPIHPARGGFVPIGRSTSGNHVFLVPPGSGGREWQVAVEMGGWALLEMGFTDFLWHALREDLEVPVIEGEPSFERIGQVDTY